MSKNQNGFVITITEEGVVEGVLTDGDFRRCIASVNNLDLSVPVRTISKKQPFVTSLKNDPATISGMFSDEIRWLPIVDDNNQIRVTIKINQSKLGPVLQTFSRYDYNIHEIYTDDETENEFQERYDHLMNYLNLQ